MWPLFQSLNLLNLLIWLAWKKVCFVCLFVLLYLFIYLCFFLKNDFYLHSSMTSSLTILFTILLIYHCYRVYTVPTPKHSGNGVNAPGPGSPGVFGPIFSDEQNVQGVQPEVQTTLGSNLESYPTPKHSGNYETTRRSGYFGVHNPDQIGRHSLLKSHFGGAIPSPNIHPTVYVNRLIGIELPGLTVNGTSGNSPLSKLRKSSANQHRQYGIFFQLATTCVTSLIICFFNK